MSERILGLRTRAVQIYTRDLPSSLHPRGRFRPHRARSARGIPLCVRHRKRPLTRGQHTTTIKHPHFANTPPRQNLCDPRLRFLPPLLRGATARACPPHGLSAPPRAWLGYLRPTWCTTSERLSRRGAFPSHLRQSESGRNVPVGVFDVLPFARELAEVVG